MEPGEALADLIEISSQIEAAVAFDPTGAVTSSTLADEGRATALARVALDLLAAAGGIRTGGPATTRVEVSLAGGCLVVVREGERLIAATTTPDPPMALVIYDLRTALRASAPPDAEPAKKKPTRRRAPKKDADVTP